MIPNRRIRTVISCRVLSKHAGQVSAFFTFSLHFRTKVALFTTRIDKFLVEIMKIADNTDYKYWLLGENIFI